MRAAAVVLAALVVIVGGGAAAYALTTPATFDITLNGKPTTVKRFASVSSLISEDLASPQPGDLIAVDGSIIEEGAGEGFAATVNGEEAGRAFWPLRKGDVVEIADGEDVMEEYEAIEAEVPFESEETGVGAIHAYVGDGEKGVVERRTGKKSGKTAEVEVAPAAPRTFLKYNADTGGDKVIALTFDDGPWPETTAQILDVLDQYDAKATFFTIGNQIEGRSDLVKRAADAGHQVCTHSWDHAAGSGQGVDLTRMPAEEQVAEVTKGLAAIEEATGAPASTVFRAPGGNFAGDIVWTLKGHITAEIGWNIDTEDWRRPGASAIANRIMRASSGDIVLMHDGGGDRSQTVEALKIALPYLQEQGYRFVTIDELLAYNNPEDMMPSEK